MLRHVRRLGAKEERLRRVVALGRVAGSGREHAGTGEPTRRERGVCATSGCGRIAASLKQVRSQNLSSAWRVALGLVAGSGREHAGTGEPTRRERGVCATSGCGRIAASLKQVRSQNLSSAWRVALGRVAGSGREHAGTGEPTRRERGVCATSGCGRIAASLKQVRSQNLRSAWRVALGRVAGSGREHAGTGEPTRRERGVFATSGCARIAASLKQVRSQNLSSAWRVALGRVAGGGREHAKTGEPTRRERGVCATSGCGRIAASLKQVRSQNLSSAWRVALGRG